MCNFDEIEAAIRLSRCKGVGAAIFKKLIDDYRNPVIALKEWEKLRNTRILGSVSEKKNTTDREIINTLEAIKNNSFKAYYYGQTGYPQQLTVLTEPPPIVYLSSDLKNKPLAAVVGSRNTDDEQIRKTEELTLKLIKEGYGIVSGGAIGVDKIAHQTALSANAYTVAVLANGIDVVYPKKNSDLFVEIREKGLLITELMVGAQPQKGFFPTRNRLIAALSEVVVALPSQNSSGTLITAKWALKLGKKLICE